MQVLQLELFLVCFAELWQKSPKLLLLFFFFWTLMSREPVKKRLMCTKLMLEFKAESQLLDESQLML